MVMKLPDISSKKQLGTNDYMVAPDPAAEKKKKILVVVGIIALLIALSFVLFSSKPTPGQQELQLSLQPMSDALGIVDKYEKELNYAPTKNDIALTQTLLRGNFQEINTMYKKFKGKKKSFTNSPKPDTKSAETLDEAVRNNTLDNVIVVTLKPKITSAEKNLKAAKAVYTKKESKDKIQAAIDDMQSISELLDRAR